MQIILFGKLREAIGEACELPAKDGETVAALRRRLAQLHPAAASDLLSPRVRACVDDVIVPEDFVIGERQRLEFFPPLSGG